MSWPWWVSPALAVVAFLGMVHFILQDNAAWAAVGGGSFALNVANTVREFLHRLNEGNR